jgi:putative ABC transport system permease protein
MNRRLPRGVETLMRLAVPGDIVESIVGDLEEEYSRRAARSGWRAAVMAWGRAARIAASFAWEGAIRERHLPPIADEAPRRTGLIDSIRLDVAFGVRMLRRQPGFTAVALVALALGIGANTAIFSIVDAVLWRPLPYAGADAIMSVAEERPREGLLYGPVSPADFYDWRRDSASFSDMAAYTDTMVNLTGGHEPERVRGTLVTGGFLRVLGTVPARGRDFRPEEEVRGRHRVVLLSDGLWRRRFGADASLVGRRVMLNDEPYEVAGILPASFWWPSDPDFLAPLALTEHDRTLRGAHFFEVVGRLRPGVSEAHAREDLRVIGRRLSTAYPLENQGHGPSLRPLRRALVGDTRTALLVLLGAVGLVLLLACANVATLLLARAAARHRELAIRVALGAARGRLVRQFLIESMVLALAGGAAGVVLAHWCIAAFHAFVPAQFAHLPGIAGVGVDARVLAFAVAASVATGLVFGVAPAVVVSDQQIGSALAAETRGAAGHARSTRLRAALVVTELALSLVLLVSAVLLIVSFRNLSEVSPGFRSEQVVTAALTLPGNRYGDHAPVVSFYTTLLERIRSLPGVQRAAATSAVPFSGDDDRLDLQIERRTEPADQPARAHPRLVTDDYFATMGIPLIKGRAFTAYDDGSAGDVVIVNLAAARRYWPGEDPLGQKISLGDPPNWMTIVGIVGDVHYAGLDADLEPEAYMPLAQGFFALGDGLERALTLVVKTSVEPAAIAPLIRTAVRGVDVQQPAGEVRPLEDLIAQSVAVRRLDYLLLGAFAFLAVTLTAAGLYGVMAYLVAQRTREIGVRMALGASRRQVVMLVLGQAGVMTVAGILVGTLCALALTRALGSLLFGISATEPTVYVLVALFLACIAIAAAGLQCLRASRIDPLVALREG